MSDFPRLVYHKTAGPKKHSTKDVTYLEVQNDHELAILSGDWYHDSSLTKPLFEAPAISRKPKGKAAPLADDFLDQ